MIFYRLLLNGDQKEKKIQRDRERQQCVGRATMDLQNSAWDPPSYAAAIQLTCTCMYHDTCIYHDTCMYDTCMYRHESPFVLNKVCNCAKDLAH